MSPIHSVKNFQFFTICHGAHKYYKTIHIVFLVCPNLCQNLQCYQVTTAGTTTGLNVSAGA